jgi:predicted amidohydrolase
MNICLIQVDSRNGEPNLNFAVTTIGERPANLYVLPELFTVGLENARTNPQKYAQSFDGSVVRCIQDALALRPTATVVAGLVERNSDAFYNAAAVVQIHHVAIYRQKYPATGGCSGQCFTRGDSKTFSGYELSNFGPKIGPMVCNDYQDAEEFFLHYKEQEVAAIVMIAEAADRKWQRTFPALCKKYSIPAIVCNSAGIKMGGSCVWNAVGDLVWIREAHNGECQKLPEGPAVGTTSLDFSS